MRLTRDMRQTADDTQLARAAAGGNAAAFSLLLERNYDRLFRLCFRLTGARADAEDLAQDICAALPEKVQQFRAEAAFSTWFARIAINAAHDRRRRSATHAKAAEGWGDWEVNRVAANAEAAQARDWLEAAMCALPEDLRDTVALVMDERTHAEVAQVLGISEGTVSWRMSEVKKRLKALREADA